MTSQATIDRLLSFYEQLPGSKRQPYGKWIVALQNGTSLTDVLEAVRCWWDRMRIEYEEKHNAFYATDFAAAGCMLNILRGREHN